MIKNPLSDRKEPNLFLEQAEESPDIDLRGHPNEESWDPAQTLNVKGQSKSSRTLTYSEPIV